MLNVADQVVSTILGQQIQKPIIAVHNDYIICDDNLPETLSVADE
jgi:hypothetical protein